MPVVSNVKSLVLSILEVSCVPCSGQPAAEGPTAKALGCPALSTVGRVSDFSRHKLPLPGHSCVLRQSMCSHGTYRPHLSEGQLVAALKFSDTKIMSRAAYSHGPCLGSLPFVPSSWSASASAGLPSWHPDVIFVSLW